MMPSPLIEVEELQVLLGQPGVSVVDASWYMPAEQRDCAAEFRAGHIPGAVFFDIDGVSDPSSGLPHTLAQPTAFAAAMGALGISSDDQIVVYDSAGLFSAARAWWNFRVAGVTNVRVLSGGLPAWRALGLPLETGTGTRPEARFVAQHHSELVRTFEQMKELVQAGTTGIVDARGAARFNGEVAEPRPGLKSGHITGSRNVPYSSLVADGRLKPVAALKDAFEQAGVDVAGPVVTTCGSGVTAAILALGLAVLGRDDVPVYDGSWSEWGGRAESAGLITPRP